MDITKMLVIKMLNFRNKRHLKQVYLSYSFQGNFFNKVNYQNQYCTVYIYNLLMHARHETSDIRKVVVYILGPLQGKVKFSRNSSENLEMLKVKKSPNATTVHTAIWRLLHFKSGTTQKKQLTSQEISLSGANFQWPLFPLIVPLGAIHFHFLQQILSQKISPCPHPSRLKGPCQEIFRPFFCYSSWAL